MNSVGLSAGAQLDVGLGVECSGPAGQLGVCQLLGRQQGAAARKAGVSYSLSSYDDHELRKL